MDIIVSYSNKNIAVGSIGNFSYGTFDNSFGHTFSKEQRNEDMAISLNNDNKTIIINNIAGNIQANSTSVNIKLS